MKATHKVCEVSAEALLNKKNNNTQKTSREALLAVCPVDLIPNGLFALRVVPLSGTAENGGGGGGQLMFSAATRARSLLLSKHDEHYRSPQGLRERAGVDFEEEALPTCPEDLIVCEWKLEATLEEHTLAHSPNYSATSSPLRRGSAASTSPQHITHCRVAVETALRCPTVDFMAFTQNHNGNFVVAVLRNGNESVQSGRAPSEEPLYSANGYVMGHAGCNVVVFRLHISAPTLHHTAQIPKSASDAVVAASVVYVASLPNSSSPQSLNGKCLHTFSVCANESVLYWPEDLIIGKKSRAGEKSDRCGDEPPDSSSVHNPATSTSSSSVARSSCSYGGANGGAAAAQLLAHYPELKQGVNLSYHLSRSEPVLTITLSCTGTSVERLRRAAAGKKLGFSLATLRKGVGQYATVIVSIAVQYSERSLPAVGLSTTPLTATLVKQPNFNVLGGGGTLASPLTVVEGSPKTKSCGPREQHVPSTQMSPNSKRVEGSPSSPAPSPKVQIHSHVSHGQHVFTVRTGVVLLQDTLSCAPSSALLFDSLQVSKVNFFSSATSHGGHPPAPAHVYLAGLSRSSFALIGTNSFSCWGVPTDSCNSSKKNSPDKSADENGIIGNTLISMDGRESMGNGEEPAGSKKRRSEKANRKSTDEHYLRELFVDCDNVSSRNEEDEQEKTNNSNNSNDDGNYQKSVIGAPLRSHEYATACSLASNTFFLAPTRALTTSRGAGAGSSYEIPAIVGTNFGRVIIVQFSLKSVADSCDENDEHYAEPSSSSSSVRVGGEGKRRNIKKSEKAQQEYSSASGRNQQRGPTSVSAVISLSIVNLSYLLIPLHVSTDVVAASLMFDIMSSSASSVTCSTTSPPQCPPRMSVSGKASSGLCVVAVVVTARGTIVTFRAKRSPLFESNTADESSKRKLDNGISNESTRGDRKGAVETSRKVSSEKVSRRRGSLPDSGERKHDSDLRQEKVSSPPRHTSSTTKDNVASSEPPSSLVLPLSSLPPSQLCWRLMGIGSQKVRGALTAVAQSDATVIILCSANQKGEKEGSQRDAENNFAENEQRRGRSRGLKKRHDHADSSLLSTPPAPTLSTRLTLVTKVATEVRGYASKSHLLSPLRLQDNTSSRCMSPRTCFNTNALSGGNEGDTTYYYGEGQTEEPDPYLGLRFNPSNAVGTPLRPSSCLLKSLCTEETEDHSSSLALVARNLIDSSEESEQRESISWSRKEMRVDDDNDVLFTPEHSRRSAQRRLRFADEDVSASLHENNREPREKENSRRVAESSSQHDKPSVGVHEVHGALEEPTDAHFNHVRGLGCGTFGAVTLAQSRDRLAEFFAVKRVRKSQKGGGDTSHSNAGVGSGGGGEGSAAPSSDFVRTFFQEAVTVMTSIPPHTNIVRYFGIYESKTFFNIVMEVAEGGSLDDVLFPPFNENTNDRPNGNGEKKRGAAENGEGQQSPSRETSPAPSACSPHQRSRENGTNESNNCVHDEGKGKRNFCNIITSNPYRQQSIATKTIGEEHKSHTQKRHVQPNDLDYVDSLFSDFSNSVADCDRHIRELQKSSSTATRGTKKERRYVGDDPPDVDPPTGQKNRDEAVFAMQDLRSAAIPASAPHIPEHLLVCWLHQCLVGLAHLHQHGVVHRDVKAANMLLACPSTGAGHDQRIMWTDFGVSAADGPSSTGGVGIGGGTSVYLGRTANGLSSTFSTLRMGEEEQVTITPRAPERTTAAVATAHRTVIGTMGFAAPEVLEHWGSGGTARYSAACDLWGIGVVLYCFITGRGWLPSGGCVGVATSPSEIIDVCCGRLPKLCALRMCGIQDGVESCDDIDGDDACEWVTDEESGDDSSSLADGLNSGDDEASPSRPHRPASQQIGANLSDSRAALARFSQAEQAQRAAAFSSDLLSLIDSLMSVDYSRRPTARKALSSRVFAARLERPLSLFVMNDSLPAAMSTAVALLTKGEAKLTSSAFGNSNSRETAQNQSWASGFPHERFASRQVRVFPMDLDSIDTIFFKQMARYQRRNHQFEQRQEKQKGITTARSRKEDSVKTPEEASERQKSRKLEHVRGKHQKDPCNDDFDEGSAKADLIACKRALAGALDAHAQALVADPHALCLTSVSRTHSIFEGSFVVEIAVGIAGAGFRELAENLKNQYINEMMREHIADSNAEKNGSCQKHRHAHLVAVSDVVLEATTLAELRLVMPSIIRKGWEAFCQEFFWRDQEEISLRQRRTLPSGMSTVYLIYTIPTRVLVHDSNACLGREEVDVHANSKGGNNQNDNEYSSNVTSFLRTLRYETLGSAFPRWLAFVRAAGSVFQTDGAGIGSITNNDHEVETEEDSSTNDWFASEAALISFFQRSLISAILERTSPTIAPPDPLFRSRAPSLLSPHGGLRHDNIFIPAPPERYSASFAASFLSVDVGCSSSLRLHVLLASVAGALIVGPRDPFGASVAAVERYCAAADVALCPVTSTTAIDRDHDDDHDDDSLLHVAASTPLHSSRTKQTACRRSYSLDFVHLCQLCFELGFVFENAASRDIIETEVISQIVSSKTDEVPAT